MLSELEILQRSFEGSLDGRIVFRRVGNDLQVVKINKAAIEMTKGLLYAGTLLGRAMPGHHNPLPRESRSLLQIYLDILDAGEPCDFELEYRGEAPGWYRNVVIPLPGGMLHMSFQDITELKTLATQDQLTGLFNRHAFDLLLDSFCQRQIPCSVLIIDLDKFKAVNDTHGHLMGDEVLISVANRIVGTCDRTCTAARLGGDEFGLICETNLTATQALGFAKSIAESVADPIVVEFGTVKIGCSIGIYLYQPGDEPEIVLKRADEAMYRAKKSGGGCQLWHDEWQRDADVNLQFEDEVKAAIALRQFKLHYQPIVDLDTRAIVGYEALIRWQHPTKGLLLPGQFLPHAIELELMPLICLYVFERALEQLEQLPDNMFLAVNGSPHSLKNNPFEAAISQLVQGRVLDRLHFEITEETDISKSETAQRVLATLIHNGVSLIIDDYGAGYALTNLAYGSTGVKGIKLDRMITSGLSDPVIRAIAISAIVLAKALNLSVVGEGVETEEQARALRAIGCRFGQGWLFGKPELMS